MNRGAKGAHRNEWRKVKPKLPLSVESWRAFEKEFELARSKVEDSTEQEARDLIFSQLPPDWQQKVVEEDCKRIDRSSLEVKVTQVPTMGEEELREDLEAMCGQRIKRCQEHPPGYRVEAYAEDGVKAILLLNNLEVLTGRRSKVSR